jgi:hypothetical protein
MICEECGQVGCICKEEEKAEFIDTEITKDDLERDHKNNLLEKVDERKSDDRYL